jgi:hypothetical protein
MSRYSDYFSFESIRDREGEVICYHVTLIGTIETDGTATMRTDMGANQDQKMAFGRVTIHGLDKKIRVLLNETGSRIYSHTTDIDGISTDVISYTAKDWRADEAYDFEVGDRVLLEGRAYIRTASNRNPDRLPELSLTVTGLFRLSRARKKHFVSMNEGLIPQE